MFDNTYLYRIHWRKHYLDTISATLQFSISFIQLVDTFSEMYDDFLVARNYGKLSAKFPSGTSAVIENVRLLPHFSFLARTTIRIRVDTLYAHYMLTICSLYVHYMLTICSLYVHCIFTIYSLY